MNLPRTILASAVLLGLGAAIAGGVAVGGAFGAGVAAATGLVCADFWLLGRRVRFLAAGPRCTSSLLLGLFSSLHLLLVAGVAWLLLQRFPPLSLLVGFSSVLSAIALAAVTLAVRSAAHPIQE
ncbi:MAG: hypothetical protein JXB39_16330 [Deltaproteobacteria bacterium]|nr:hypothetical protein [Deltaproteobacteria bacterium]